MKKHSIIFVLILVLGFLFGSSYAEGDVPNEDLCSLASLNKFVGFSSIENFDRLACGFHEDEQEIVLYQVYLYSGSIEELDQILVENLSGYQIKDVDSGIVEGMITKFFDDKGGLYLELLDESGLDVGLYIKETDREGIIYVDFMDYGIEDDTPYRPYLDQNVARWFLNFDLTGNWFEDYAVLSEWIEFSWEDGEMLNRSITFDVGEDFESLKKLVFSNDFIYQYGNYLTEAPLQNYMEGGLPALAFSTIDGMSVIIRFDEEQHQMEMNQFSNDVSTPLNEYGKIEQEPFALSEITSVYDFLKEGVNPFDGFYSEQYADNFDLRGYNIEILPYGRMDFEVIYLIDGLDSMEAGIAISEWVPSIKENYDWYINKADFDIYGENMYVTGHYYLLNEKDLFLDAFKMNYVPELFEFGMLEGISERDEFYSKNIQFAMNLSDLETKAYIIHQFGEEYATYSDYIISEEYQNLVEANGGVDFLVSMDEYDQMNVTFHYGDVEVNFTFYDEYEEIAISESTMVAGIDLRDLVK